MGAWELDHLFFATAAPDDVEQELTSLGVKLTPPRRHPGQGTANRCMLVDGAFIEVLRAVDGDELRAEPTRGLRLDERIRWKETGACPFGLCFRAAGGPPAEGTLPFETWPYRPAYLPPDWSIPVATPPANLADPLVFVAPWPRRPGAIAPAAGELGAGRAVTAVTLQRPPGAPPLSPAVAWLVGQGLFGVRDGAGHALEVVLGAGAERRRHELTSAPLALRW